MTRLGILFSTILVLSSLLFSHPHNGTDIILSIVNKEKEIKDSKSILSEDEFQAFSTALDEMFHHNSDGSERENTINSKVENSAIDYLWCYAKLYQLRGNIPDGAKFYAKFLSNYRATPNFNPLVKIPLTDLFIYIQKNILLDEEMQTVYNELLKTVEEESKVVGLNERKKVLEGRLKQAQDYEEKKTKSINRVSSNRYSRVISNDYIKSLSVNTLVELLESIPGLDVKKRGSYDANSTLSLFAGSPNQVLILVDGLEIGNNQSVLNILNFPLSINNIESIEITPGAHSRKYGADAYSGVINIITTDKFSSDNSFHYGDFNSLDLNLGVNFMDSHSFYYGSKASDGYVDHTSYELNTFNYKYMINTKSTSTDMTFGLQTKKHGVVNQFSQTYPNQYNINLTKFFRTDTKWSIGSFNMKSSTYWVESEDSLTQTYGQPNPFWKDVRTTEIGHSFDSEIRYSFGSTSLSTKVNRKRDQNHEVEEFQRNEYSLSINQNITLSKLVFNFGTSASYFDDFGWFYAPGIDIGYKLTDNSRIYQSYDWGYRVPTFFEMHASDYEFYGNDEISEEKTDYYEYGLSMDDSRLSANISLFYKSSTDMIDWKFDDSINRWKTSNIDYIVANGHSVNISFNTPEVKWIDIIDFGYNYVDVEYDEDVEYRFISNYLKHQLFFNFAYSFQCPITKIGEIKNSFQYRYEHTNSPLDNRYFLDIEVSYKLWKIVNSLSIKNLMDVQYQDETNIILPGRLVRYSLIFEL